MSTGCLANLIKILSKSNGVGKSAVVPETISVSCICVLYNSGQS